MLVLGLALGLSGCFPEAPITRTVTYSIVTDGDVGSNVDELAAVAAAAYSSPAGWRPAGIEFVQVPSGGDFTIVLANAERLPNYDPVCSPYYSCQVGRYVIINDLRFAFGSDAWPGPLDLYRIMVINHETGHWLGRGHASCPGPGALAPVMQQQSKGMQGCEINPWPLQWEKDAVVR